jgi:hypothetical protein
MRRAIVVGSVVLLIVSIAGFITSLVLNVFVFDESDAYGEVPIPGTATLHLPAGDATVNFTRRSSAAPAADCPSQTSV